MAVKTPSCFVKGVVEAVTDQLLKDTLTSRFGPLKELDIVRSVRFQMSCLTVMAIADTKCFRRCRKHARLSSLKSWTTRAKRSRCRCARPKAAKARFSLPPSPVACSTVSM